MTTTTQRHNENTQKFMRDNKTYSDKPAQQKTVRETVEEFIARGGKILAIEIGATGLHPVLSLPKSKAQSQIRGVSRAAKANKK